VPDLPASSFYSSYLATYLERDVRQILNVASLRDFERFIRALAPRSGQLLNKTDLARDVGVSTKAIHDWLSVLQASNQIVLRKQNQVSEHPAVFWFYRDKPAREIDFIIEKDGFLSLAECKWTENPDKNDVKKIMAIDSEILSNNLTYKPGKHYVIGKAGNSYSMNEKVDVIGLDSLSGVLTYTGALIRLLLCRIKPVDNLHGAAYRLSGLDVEGEECGDKTVGRLIERFVSGGPLKSRGK
jgi:predicted AAA+ superfamily ATPase